MSEQTRASGGREAIANAIGQLRGTFPGRVETGKAVRARHANTLTWIKAQPPDAVVYAITADEVCEIVKIASAYRTPLIPFGAGTSLEGHVNAPFGGIAIDLSRMNRIIAVNEHDLDCTVEAGVTRQALDAHLAGSGLFFSVDPGAEEATLGGMAATRASGTNTVRYGSMRDNVVSLTAVMADGSIIRSAGRARKSSAGYDLTHLLIGSEGTLGIITNLTVRLHVVPSSIVVGVCPFSDIDGACRAAIEAVQQALCLARIELLDDLLIHAVNRHAGTDLQEQPTLFVELHGTPASTAEQVGMLKEIAIGNGAKEFAFATDENERRRLWRARHDAFRSLATVWPNKAVLSTDVCVPISQLASCIQAAVEDIKRLGLTAPIVGHVGDGNFHVLPVFDPLDDAQRRSIKSLLQRLVDHALAAGGTCTGEHGIGQGKIAFLEQELGCGVDVMRRIKHGLDPLNILNPGKIFTSLP